MYVRYHKNRLRVMGARVSDKVEKKYAPHTIAPVPSSLGASSANPTGSPSISGTPEPPRPWALAEVTEGPRDCCSVASINNGEDS